MFSSSPTTTGVSAPYGHACAGCSRAKCKCVTRNGSSCERCHRLGKECAPAALVRKRRPRKPTPAARRSQLEDKLSDLVSLLQAQHSQPTVNDLGNVLSVPQSVSPHPTNAPSMAEASLSNCRNALYQSLTPITMASKSTAHVSPASNNAGICANSVSQMKDEQDLHTFRTLHLKCFPLLYLSDETTVEELRRERPFLWLNIQAICTRLPSQQHDLGMQIRKILATRILVEEERSIDMLLGLLVFLSWSFYFARGKPLLGMSSSIAKSLVINLRLDRPAGTRPPADGPVATFYCHKPWTFLEPAAGNEFRSNEERRALLACFVLTGTLSLITAHDPMRWGPQMDEAILKLSEEHQCPEDELLVALARISKVSEDAAALIRYGFEDTESVGPALIHVKSLRNSLDQVRNLLSADLLCNKTVLSYLYSAEVMIHEIALFQLPSASFYRTFDFRRFEYLHNCVPAIKSGLDNFLSLDSDEFRGSNFSIMLQFSHSIQVLHRLSCLQNPGWDRDLIRSTANVLSYLEQVAARMDQAHEDWKLETNSEEITVYTRGAQLLRLAAPMWAASMEKADADAVPGDEMGSEPMRSAIDDTLMEFSDESWFTDVFGSLNY
ncbi:hypothetical protein K505DRAFT_302533 [Melanomma pulvis-pyrius CBS 109.77]|uniref:Zn(2)-C6 fungal-type domain-containing protein n=1 Tax=Melanomma pulvis-pyrius CBS 109.77 TaxID=1314802 RepID=A0A6A6XGM2_9PLEO|nr:hypothetical protein K505DRAFT_302533 [Melanomma pulvis-pyrius CBS 109.77]